MVEGQSPANRSRFWKERSSSSPLKGCLFFYGVCDHAVMALDPWDAA